MSVRSYRTHASGTRDRSFAGDGRRGMDWARSHRAAEGAPPPGLPPTTRARPLPMNRTEVVVLAPLRDTPCDARALLVGVAEVDPRPNACIDHFVDRLGETGEAAGEPAVVRVRPADAVGAEEVLEGCHHRAAEARVARRMLR